MNLSGDQWGVMNETGSYPGQPWLWLYTLWYYVPGFSASANVDMIAVYLTGLATILLLLIPFIPGLRDIPRWIPVHRLIWRSWDRPRPAPAPRARSGLQVAQDGQHPAVIGVRRRQAELAEDVPDVLLHRPLGDHQDRRRSRRWTGPRPSAPSTSRSRAVSAPSPSVRRLAPSSWVTTSGSSAVPPAATRLSASMNSPTSATRSLSRYPTPAAPRPDAAPSRSAA